jgi:hypothetical protein
MRYVVVDKRGRWQASYSQKIPSFPIKEIKSWAISTAKLVGGKVLETIVPSDPKYPKHDVVLYDFTYLPSKLKDFRKPSHKKPLNESNDKEDKKDK